MAVKTSVADVDVLAVGIGGLLFGLSRPPRVRSDASSLIVPSTLVLFGGCSRTSDAALLLLRDRR